MDGNGESDLNKKFWDVLLFYSNSKTKDVAKEEWTALSKHANLCDLKGGVSKELIEHYQIKKLPPRKKNCICTHWIVKNKFIFNIKNRNILTLGSCCIRRYLSYTPKKICLECETPFNPSGRKGRNYCPPCKLKWCSERGYSHRRSNSENSEREKLCLDCNTPFIPTGRRGRNYCPPCKQKWCSERGYRYGRFHYESMRQTGHSMRANFHNFGNFSAMPNEGRESEFCTHGTSKSSNPKSMPNKEHQLEFCEQVEALKFTNKAVLFKYLESQEYIQGTKKINFGKYSEKPLKDFNDPGYFKWFTEVIKPKENQRLNDEQLSFYFYVSYMHKNF